MLPCSSCLAHAFPTFRGCTPPGTVNLDFWNTNLSSSDFGSSEGSRMRWVNVTQDANGRAIDMTLGLTGSEIADGACSGPKGNRAPCTGGLERGFTWIDFKCSGNLNSLQFGFEWSDTHEAATLPGVDLSIIGLNAYESFQAKLSDYSYYTVGSRLDAIEGSSWAKFVMKNPGDVTPNAEPKVDPVDLTNEQKKFAARLFVTGASQFRARLRCPNLPSSSIGGCCRRVVGSW